MIEYIIKGTLEEIMHKETIKEIAFMEIILKEHIKEIMHKETLKQTINT